MGEGECSTYRAAFNRSNCGHTVFGGGACMGGTDVESVIRRF